MKISLSPLSHTWLIDIDGTILKHNGYLESNDQLLEGIKEFWIMIPKNDYIILLTSRSKSYEKRTIEFLNINNLRYNQIVFNLPTGERILLNDTKPSGLQTAIAINLKRNAGLNSNIIEFDEDL